VEDAKLLERLGCFALVLEKSLAEKVAKSISIPVIGAGGVDGQVLSTIC
jgi:3-methyl-2-oxobutanoate hydroxymethyltransferase